MAYKQYSLKTNNYVGAHYFRVTIDGYVVADEGILRVSGLTMNHETIRFRMSLDLTQRRLPGYATADDVTIERVYRGHDGLWSWYSKVRDGEIDRKDVKIELLKHNGETMSTVTLLSAYPNKWEFPGLDASTSQQAVEKITLCVENMSYETTEAKD